MSAAFLQHAAKAIRRGLSPGAVPAVYRRTATVTPRVATATPAGSTSVTLNSLPAGYAPKAGDSFTWGAGVKHTVSADATPAGGSVTVAFAPALTLPLSAGAQVTMNRSSDHAVKIIPEQLDGVSPSPGIYAGGDWRVIVLGLPDDIEPTSAGDFLVWDGRTVKVQSGIGRDPAGTGWIVQAR